MFASWFACTFGLVCVPASRLWRSSSMPSSLKHFRHASGATLVFVDAGYVSKTAILHGKKEISAQDSAKLLANSQNGGPAWRPRLLTVNVDPGSVVVSPSSPLRTGCCVYLS